MKLIETKEIISIHHSLGIYRDERWEGNSLVFRDSLKKVKSLHISDRENFDICDRSWIVGCLISSLRKSDEYYLVPKDYCWSIAQYVEGILGNKILLSALKGWDGIPTHFDGGICFDETEKVKMGQLLVVNLSSTDDMYLFTKEGDVLISFSHHGHFSVMFKRVTERKNFLERYNSQPYPFNYKQSPHWPFPLEIHFADADIDESQLSDELL